MRRIIVLIFIFHSIIAVCQDRTYYLEGTLAKSKIYMEIEVFDSESVNATYFYQNSLKDIKLEGKVNKNTFTLFFKPDDLILEKFYLNKSANNTFTGSWYNASGKQFSVQLQPVNFSNYRAKLDDQYADDKLNFVKCKFLEFKKQKITTYKNKEFVWYSEKHCNSDFFRLGSDFSEKNKAILNPILEQIHIENTLDQLNCSSSFEYSQGKGIDGNSTINYLNDNLLGFKISHFWDCGGAHPDFGSSGYLIDLNNGKNYEIDDILAFDKSVTTEKQSDFDHFSEYRNNYFAPKLLAIITSTEHFTKPKDNDEDACDYTDEEYWNYPSWNFTEKGIEFTPIFARVDRSCEESFLVPFEKLKKSKNLKFPYDLK